MNIAYIGLGSNLEQPQQQVITALTELDQLPNTRLVKQSRLYASDPMGPPDQPDYINAVALLETSLSAMELLAHCQSIEADHLRRRLIRWGPRTLDLDILLYNQEVSDDPVLTLPHPGVHERNFVLLPLMDLNPELKVLNHSLSHWLEQTGQQGIRVLRDA